MLRNDIGDFARCEGARKVNEFAEKKSGNVSSLMA
jgi:hypothetical protein